MTVDVKKIAVGDEVTVRGTVGRIEQGDRMVPYLVKTEKSCAWVHPSEIATHTLKPRELKVGDEMKLHGHRVKIVFVSGQRAWVEGVSLANINEIAHLDDLEPSDD